MLRLARRKDTRLHLFLSSPGDCQEERGRVCEIVDRINASEAARERRIEIKVVRWEDLPPGEAQPGNLQVRIDDLLKRYGLSRFEVYLGCMKDRVGTRSGEAESGTLKELADAVERRRRTGLPVEILFYFTRERAARPAPVQAIADDLAARGLLFRETSSLEQFVALVERHLSQVVTEWFAWRNRLKRAAARSPAMIAAVLAALVLLVGGTNIVALSRMENALRRDGPRAAAESWQAYKPYMIYQSGIRAKINDAMATAIVGQDDLERALEAFGWWAQQPVFEPERAGNARSALAARVSVEIDRLVVSTTELTDLALWQRAINAGLWAKEAPEPSASLGRIAAKRLFDTLISQGSDPTTWAKSDLTIVQTNAVRAYAESVLATHSNLLTWGDRPRRLAIAAVLSDARLGEILATDALGRYDTFEQSEIAFFLGSAAPEDTAAWLRERLSPQLSLATLGRMVEAINARGDATITIAFMDQIAAGRTDPAAAQLEIKLDCADEPCRMEALARVRRWPDAAMGPMLSLVLDATVPEAAPMPERAALAATLIQRLRAGNGQHPANDAILRFLARLQVPAGAALLDERIAAYLAGRSSFGFAERAALIDGLRSSGAGDRLERARDLSKTAEADVASLRKRQKDYGATAIGVHTAYVDLLSTAMSAWPRHAAYVRSLIDLRLADKSFAKDRFDTALARLLAKLPEDALLGIFDLPRAPLTDDPFGESKWERRGYLLGILGGAAGLLPDRLVRALSAYNPTETGSRESLDGFLAEHGGTTAAGYFKAELARGRLDCLRLLAISGDAEAVNKFIRALDGMAADARTKALPAVAAAIEALAEGPARRAIADAVPRFGHDAYLLWRAAREIGLQVPELVAIAERIVGEARDGSRVPSAVRYLVAVDPDRIGRILEDSAIAQTFEDYLKASSAWDWAMVAQELASVRVPLRVVADSGQRGMLVALEPNQIGLSSRLEQGYMPYQGKLVSNPLLFGAAIHGDAQEGAQILLQLATVPPASIDVLGALADRRTAYQAYALWLAAMAAERTPLAVHDLRRQIDLVTLLRDSEPAVAKAAAALIASARSS
jgi:hypothetical protein